MVMLFQTKLIGDNGSSIETQRRVFFSDCFLEAKDLLPWKWISQVCFSALVKVKEEEFRYVGNRCEFIKYEKRQVGRVK
jgi:hypothetical protein